MGVDVDVRWLEINHLNVQQLFYTAAVDSSASNGVIGDRGRDQSARVDVVAAASLWESQSVGISS